MNPLSLRLQQLASSGDLEAQFEWSRHLQRIGNDVALRLMIYEIFGAGTEIKMRWEDEDDLYPPSRILRQLNYKEHLSVVTPFSVKMLWDIKIAKSLACDIAEHVLPVFSDMVPGDQTPYEFIQLIRKTIDQPIEDKEIQKKSKLLSQSGSKTWEKIKYSLWQRLTNPPPPRGKKARQTPATYVYYAVSGCGGFLYRDHFVKSVASYALRAKPDAELWMIDRMMQYLLGVKTVS